MTHPRIAFAARFRLRHVSYRNSAVRWKRGAVALEYAIVLPALLLFVLGIMDVGRYLWTTATLNRAIQAAARCGAVNPAACGTAAQIENYAVTKAYGLNVAVSTFTSSAQSCGSNVTADYSFELMIPWFGTSNTSMVQASACYPLSH
jgi:Flp pilus assembly protein TadG